MHRPTARSGMKPQTRSLWKRIWWSIYIRDKHTSAALGRPFRINREDCDVEALLEPDFEFDSKVQASIIPAQRKHNIFYVIHMSKLAILRKSSIRRVFAH
ncbi:hypothetical protein LTR41_011513 [Exophiala xenobiotica]|nr:hypothetical protein LTR41_011513 [Exophiala xenobiotica]